MSILPGSPLRDGFERQTHIVFCDRGLAGDGARVIVQLRFLDPLVERIIRKFVQDRGHPPGKPFSLPDTAQTDFRVLLQQVLPTQMVTPGQKMIKRVNIGSGEIETLGPGGWHDMGRIADQEQVAKLHGFGHKAAQRRNAFLD